jgi:hypothetical protein
VQALWQFQASVLDTSSAGQEYEALFREHSPELSLILLRNPDLRASVQQALTDLTPAVQALTQESNDVIISADMVNQIESIVDALAAEASPTLRNDLYAAWEEVAPERFIGMTVTEAWQSLTQSNTVYLPTIAN